MTPGLEIPSAPELAEARILHSKFRQPVGLYAEVVVQSKNELSALYASLLNSIVSQLMARIIELKWMISLVSILHHSGTTIPEWYSLHSWPIAVFRVLLPRFQYLPMMSGSRFSQYILKDTIRGITHSVSYYFSLESLRLH